MDVHWWLRIPLMLLLAAVVRHRTPATRSSSYKQQYSSSRLSAYCQYFYYERK